MPDNNICSPLVPNFIQFGQLWKVGTEVPLCQCVKYGFTALMSTKLKNHFLRFVDMFCIIILRKTSTPAHAWVSTPHVYIKRKRFRASWPFYQQHSVFRKPKDKSQVNISTKVNKQKIMLDEVRIYNKLVYWVCLVYLQHKVGRRRLLRGSCPPHIYTFSK